MWHFRLEINAPKAALLLTHDPFSEVVEVESGPVIDFSVFKHESVPHEVGVLYNMNRSNFFLTKM